MTGHWTIEVQTLRPVSAGAVVWRMDGSLCLTLVAKATFGLVPDGSARLVAPSPLHEDDVFRGGSPSGSLAYAHDLAPYRPRADVTLTGHAHAPDNTTAPALAVRLSVYGEEASFEKTLHVHGDRTDSGTRPQPFSKMPLTWERAVADPEQNPVGVVAGGGRMPNLIDPMDPTHPAGFGPVAPHWGVRARHLKGEAPQRRGSTVAVPSGLDWSFYQVAPVDQQLSALRGDEQIVLDNLLPSAARLSTRLPSARAVARLFGADSPTAGFPLELEADTLAIDADRQVCSVVWRGCLSIVGQERDLSQLTAVLGIELPGYPMPWDRPPPVSVKPAASIRREDDSDAPPPPGAPSARGGSSTVAFSPEEAQRLIAAAGVRAPPPPDFGPSPLVADPGEETTAVAPVPSALGGTMPLGSDRTAREGGHTRALTPEEAASLLRNAPRPPSLPEGLPPPDFGPPILIGDDDSTTSLIDRGLLERGDSRRRDGPPSEPPDSDLGGTLAISAEDAGLLLEKPVMPFQVTAADAPAPPEPLHRSETLVIEIEPEPARPLAKPR